MRKLLVIALSVCTLAACKKDDNKNQSAASTDFSSYREFDVNGVYLGNIGNAGDDYASENWPEWVFDGFKPLDTVNLTGYRMQPDVNVQALYPNPCRDNQTLKYFSVEPVNLKLMIIDEQKNVHFLKSVHLNNINGKVPLNYTGLSLVPGNHYRMFFGFSAENKPFYVRGHIDMYIK